MEELTRQSVEEFLDQTATRTPTPGGGSVASVAGALATALARMVAAYSIGKKTAPEARAKVEEAAARLLRTDALLRALATRDAIAYSAMTAAAKALKEDPATQSTYDQAVLDAVAVPMEIAALASKALATMDQFKDVANRYLLSDLGVAAVLADATAQAARYTVDVNLPEIADPGTQAKLRSEIATIVLHAGRDRASIEAYLRERLEGDASTSR